MEILIGAEESGVVRDEFAAMGHTVISCDLQPSRRPGPHYQGDVFDLIDYPFDMALFYLPCTDSSVSGARHFEAKRQDGRFYVSNALWIRGWRRSMHIPKRCFEHPVSVISSLFRKPDQIIQPWMFGHYETKATCFWLDGLPPPRPALQDAGRVCRGAGHPSRHAVGRPHPQDGPGPEPRSRQVRNLPRCRAREGAPVGRTDRDGGSSVSAAENNPTPLSLLPIKAVKLRVGLSESTIYRMLNLGTFPKPRKVGGKSLWRSDELEAWILAQGFEDSRAA